MHMHLLGMVSGVEIVSTVFGAGPSDSLQDIPDESEFLHYFSGLGVLTVSTPDTVVVSGCTPPIPCRRSAPNSPGPSDRSGSTHSLAIVGHRRLNLPYTATDALLAG